MTDTPTSPRGRSPRSPRAGLRSRALSLLTVLGTVLAAFLVVPPPAAHAAGNGEWSVDPYVPPGGDQNNRRYFFLNGSAGDTINDTVVITNSSERPMTFKVFGADAFNTPRDGAFSVRRIDDPQKGIGAWLRVAPGQDTVTLQPKTRIAVPFGIAIPANARPGDHIGGILALNTEPVGQQQDGQVRVDLKMQVGARIYLKVDGPTLPAMEVRDVRVERDAGIGEFFGSGAATIHYTVVNRGNVIVRPHLELKVSGLFGRTLLTRTSDPRNPLEIFPGESVELVQKWGGAPRLDRVDVDVKAVSEQDGVTLSDKAGTAYTAVPWPALLTLALLLIAGGVAWQLLRNRKGGGGTGDDKAENNGPDAPAGDDAAPGHDGTGKDAPETNAPAADGSPGSDAGTGATADDATREIVPVPKAGDETADPAGVPR
ncbi:DUF916 domain-containing protein [Yinghuangia sp. ASG 101]|uniref:WxL protein peptidoglycan domain-containing protein n=1 Tax=Yinghuangia sp. ASG 101 TaxID=2896848 RepID=UPI001E47F71F|nr:DUF916 domain-containing protein [Yinghuangia sp. ASG 101]UGQ09497.1 DUF916 domain-containing protein [Yinghuangia sp. ASG 101]